MESKHVEIYQPVYKMLEQAAQDSHVDASLLANAMIEFLCEELGHPKSMGLRIKLQERVLYFDNDLFSEALESGLIGTVSDDETEPKAP